MYAGVCFHDDNHAYALGKKFNIKRIEGNVHSTIFAGLNWYGGEFDLSDIYIYNVITDCVREGGVGRRGNFMQF
jgi:hypothetical protein